MFVGRTDGRIVPARGPPDFGCEPSVGGARQPTSRACSLPALRSHSLAACAPPALPCAPPALPCAHSWDPIFEPSGFGETYAELDKDVKNGISHRYRALDRLRAYLLAHAGPAGGAH